MKCLGLVFSRLRNSCLPFVVKFRGVLLDLGQLLWLGGVLAEEHLALVGFCEVLALLQAAIEGYIEVKPAGINWIVLSAGLGDDSDRIGIHIKGRFVWVLEVDLFEGLPFLARGRESRGAAGHVDNLRDADTLWQVVETALLHLGIGLDRDKMRGLDHSALGFLGDFLVELGFFEVVVLVPGQVVFQLLVRDALSAGDDFDEPDSLFSP